MHIALLGATSQIARDFVETSAAEGTHAFSLYARRPDAVQQWAEHNRLANIVQVAGFDAFGCSAYYDAVINFVGVGDPALAQAMGASILDITLEFDGLVLEYIKQHPSTRYIYLSSGAVYGSDFQSPANDQTCACFDINHLRERDWYGVAKFYAESRHRAFRSLPIVDLRVFSYFSRSQNLSTRFFLSDMLRAIRDNTLLQTSADYVVRDFLHPSDFHRLVMAVLSATATNTAIDCYSRAPVDKPTLLHAMQTQFGLRYAVAGEDTIVNVTKGKSHYYSLSRRATEFGYQPQLTSIEGVLMDAAKVLQHAFPSVSKV